MNLTLDPAVMWIMLGVLVLIVAVALVWKATHDKALLQQAHGALTAEYNKVADELKVAQRYLGPQTTTVPINAAPSAASLALAAAPVKALPTMHVSRDEFMKSIGTDFPLPVMLDNKLIHGGTGEPVKFFQDSASGHIYQGMPNA